MKERKKKEKRKEITLPKELQFPVIGIGASAGGLAAFESFFLGMANNDKPNMAFVLIQHLDPDHKSILTSLIQRFTKMDVYEAENEMVVKVNCVYIIPPAGEISLSNGKLQVSKPTTARGHRLPIDFFFQSLADEKKENAIGIILSGNGSDGSQGLRAIKSVGGLTIAQTITSADFDGMPRSAINTGMVDYELIPSDMFLQILTYTSFILKDFNKIPATERIIESSLQKIFLILRNKTGHDFSGYKSGTINRRIERRMAITQKENLEDYTLYLKENSNEGDLLFRDLLISVTNFFRDPEVFQFLESQIIPLLFQNKPPGSVIRVWIPGCATGEEVYSIAIIIQEHIDSLKQNYKLQIFATDIDDRAIAFARIGIYPNSIANDVSPERLTRFFVAEPTNTAYRISKGIRDIIVFSEQDAIKDPPFSKLDFISCRNLLIYLDLDLQKKLISLFHYALSPKGILLLGTSETIGELNDLFSVVDRKRKLYERKENFRPFNRSGFGKYFTYTEAITNRELTHNKVFPQNKKIPFRELTEQVILNRIAPSSVLVNRDGDILYIHGRTGLYLEPSAGEVGVNNIFKMARDGLRHELSMAFKRVVITKETVQGFGLRVKTNGHFTKVDFIICIAQEDKLNDKEELYLISLAESREQKSLSIEKREEQGDFNIKDSNLEIEILRKELLDKENYLQGANEELETSNEELKSSNEEMQSINEELQSTNEELETSKEEMQSINEELTTVNSELSSKLTDLSRANNDMNNLISGTGIATIFVDFSMQILRFTPAATRIVNLISTDVGRPIGHILSNLENYDRLLEDIQMVMDTLIPKEMTVQTKDHSWYTLRILPYRTLENIIEGAVITFVDITETHNAEVKIKALLEEKDIILKEVHHRIKNNMSTIYSILSLQANMLSDSSAIAVLTDAGNRVRSMILLYDKLYNSDNFNSVSMKEYLPVLIEAILLNFPNHMIVKVECKIEDFILDAKRVQSIGIITNELLTNIMKYAFIGKDSGLIIVSSSMKDKLVSFTIEDNGNGIPELIDFKKSTGFGLMLVEMLTKQLRGRIRIERQNGTKVILEFGI